MDDNAILSSLKRAGIPKEALGTTLLKEKCKEMRDYISLMGYKDKSIAYISPSRSTLAFYTMAKEMVLAGRTVFCCRLVDLHTALFKDTEEAEALLAHIESSEVIAVENFYDEGGNVSPFFTPYESAYFVSWFIRQHQYGKVFILHAAQELLFAIDWWPSSFIEYIKKRCVSFVVSASKGTSNE